MATLFLNKHTNISEAILSQEIKWQFNNQFDLIDTIYFPSAGFFIDDNIESFKKCQNLKTLTNIKYANKIGAHAFENCKLDAGKIWLDKQLIDIGEYAFYNSGIKDIDFGSHSHIIKSYAFANCNQLNINLNLAYIDNIYDYAFSNSSIKTVSFKSNAIIGNYAFYNCLQLIDLNNISRVSKIGAHAFENCNLSSKTFWFDKQNVDIDQYAFANCQMKQIGLNNILKISNHVLENNTISACYMQNAKIIGDYAFASCYNFPDKISLPNCIEIGRYAFLSCQNLSNLNAPQCTFVDYNAFYGTKLWDVDPQQ